MARGMPYQCPNCKSINNVRKGKRITKQLGVRRIRFCNDCKRKFTPRHQKQDLESDS